VPVGLFLGEGADEEWSHFINGFSLGNFLEIVVISGVAFEIKRNEILSTRIQA